MHWFRAVSLMRYGLRQQSIECLISASCVLIRHPFVAQRIHVRRRTQDVRPHLLQLRFIAGVPIVLRHQIYELAVAVVFGNRRRAMLVDAARHLAVLVLEGRVPVDEFLDVGGVTEPEQRGRSKRSVADPRARIATRARLDRRAVAVDEDVGQLGPHRLRVPRCRWRKRDRHPSEFLAPFAPNLLELRVHRLARLQISSVQRNRDVDRRRRRPRRDL